MLLLHGHSSPSAREPLSSAIPQMEVQWLNSLRNYLNHHIGGSFQLDRAYIPSLEREHDYYIMDAIMQSAKFTSSEIKKLNYCRMYLQAVSLSDITNATGDTLDTHMQTGTSGM
jgi:hypothetical protein